MIKEEHKCYNVAADLIAEASRQFGSTWVIDEEKQRGFQRCCEIIDKAIEEFGVQDYEVEVDDVTARIIITLTVKDIIIENRDHDLYRAMMAAETLRISKCEDEYAFNIAFEFPSVWRHSNS